MIVIHVASGYIGQGCIISLCKVNSDVHDVFCFFWCALGQMDYGSDSGLELLEDPVAGALVKVRTDPVALAL